jgi:Fic family protein
MSSQIQRERESYYAVLERCQKGTLDITTWVEWFLNCLARGLGSARETLHIVLVKAGFWRAHAGESFNERQRKVINRLLDGFEGKLGSSKWASLAKCSQDTALRDIGELSERKILIKDPAGGRSTRYQLCLPSE